MIFGAVEYVVVSLAVAHQVHDAERSQLTGNRRLRHFDPFCQVFRHQRRFGDHLIQVSLITADPLRDAPHA